MTAKGSFMRLYGTQTTGHKKGDRTTELSQIMGGRHHNLQAAGPTNGTVWLVAGGSRDLKGAQRRLNAPGHVLLFLLMRTGQEVLTTSVFTILNISDLSRPNVPLLKDILSSFSEQASGEEGGYRFETWDFKNRTTFFMSAYCLMMCPLVEGEVLWSLCVEEAEWGESCRNSNVTGGQRILKLGKAAYHPDSSCLYT